MKIAAHLASKALLLNLATMLALAIAASAQDTTDVVRIANGIPIGMKRIALTQMESNLQSKAMKLAAKNGYKPNKDWNDTVKYWTDEKLLSAVSFINSSYEYSTVIFDQHGKWRQTTSYPNPEFNETSLLMTKVDAKGYQVQALNSPIGPIIKYQTTHDTWFEAEVYESQSPQTTVIVLLNKKVQFIGLKK